MSSDHTRVTQTLIVGVEASLLDDQQDPSLVQKEWNRVTYAGWLVVSLPADDFHYAEHRMHVYEVAQQFKDKFGVEPQVYLYTHTEVMARFSVPTAPHLVKGISNADNRI